MKLWKKLLCLCAALLFALSAGPVAFAEDTTVAEDDARFAGKTWDQVIETFLEEHHLDTERVGLGYYNTVTGEEQYHNPDTYYIAASMFKVPLNMLFCEKISRGEMDWNTDVRGYRYEYLLRGTIIDSNNDLAEILWRAFGQGKWVPYRYYREQIAPYMGEDADNVDDLYYRNNLFTSRQMIQCLHLLYDNPDRFPRLLDTMKEAEPNRFFLNHPQKVEVAHKYGYVVEDGYLYLNDCGVCYTEDPICIVCFTQGCPEPYKVLADYCTLMIDYAEYHTAERHRQELEEARQAAILAMNQPAQESAAPVEIQASVDEPAVHTEVKTEPAAVTEEEEAADIRTPVMCFLVFVLMAGSLATLIKLRQKKQLRFLWGAAALLLCFTALLLCLFAPRMKTAVSTRSDEPEDPQKSVAAFFDAIVAKNYGTAYTYLYDYASLGLEDTPDSEAARLMADALRGSYSWMPYGESRVDGLHAKQQVVLDVLDLQALQADLKAGTEEAVARLSEELPRDQVLDSNGEYLPEFTERAYLETLQELLSRPSRYQTSVGLDLELYYTVDGWRILTDSRLISALSGRASAVKGGESA